MSNINTLIHDLFEAKEKALRLRHELERVRNSIGDLGDRVDAVRGEEREQLIATRRRARDKERHLLTEILEADLYAKDCEEAYVRNCTTETVKEFFK